MKNLDLSVIGDAIHRECNQKYFTFFLKKIQDEAEKIGITFSQVNSSFSFSDLNIQIQKRIEIVFTVSRIYYLFPKLSYDRALSWALDDLETGYSERFILEIFNALSEENVYIHPPQFLEEISNFDENTFMKNQLEIYYSKTPL